MEFTVVVLATLALGIAAAPLGLALGLSPVAVWLGTVLGAGCFVVLATQVLTRAGRRASMRARAHVGVLGPIAVPAARWLARSSITRLGGWFAPDDMATLDRGVAAVRRLGLPGAGLLGPMLGRWTMPAAGVALGADRPRLVGWLLIGVALWAGVLVGGCQLVIVVLG